MRIDALRLIAFGPFTDAVLDLGRGRHGLHLVYGPNEAGKSSALRALRHLLYGIPERSPDDFLHRYRDMRIGAVLSTDHGKTLSVIRRKGRAGTLRGADDATVIEEAELTAFLRGVDADLFATMFGIRHEDLVRGGREIVQGGGDVGRLVFSAASGIANLREVQSDLQAQIDGLFKPSAQKPRINDALSRLQSTRKSLREAQLAGDEWERHHEALRDAQARKETLVSELAGLQKEKSRLGRIAEAYPLIARRREAAVSLESLADAVLLPEDFPEVRRQHQQEKSHAHHRKTEAADVIAACRQEIAGLDPSPALLENADRIEGLYRDLGTRAKAAEDRISLDARRRTLLGEARESLRRLRDDLSLEEAETLRLKRTETVRIQRLAAPFERIRTRMEEAGRRLPEIDRGIADIDKALSALPAPRPMDALRAATAEAAEAVPLERQLAAETIEIEEAARALADGQERLGLPVDAGEALERLPTPSTETLRKFEAELDAAERRRSDVAAEIQQVRDALADVQGRIEAARLDREVPGEGDLVRARDVRDRGWRLIAAALGDDPAPEEDVGRFVASVPPSRNLVEAFDRAMTAADEVSDRLRREADRVAEKARLLSDRRGLEERLERLEGCSGAAENRFADLETRWSALWEQVGVVPLSPREMAHWIHDFEALRRSRAELGVRRAKAKRLSRDLARLGEALAHGLAEMGEACLGPESSLAGLTRRAEEVISAEQALAQERRQLGRDRERLEKERLEAAERLQAAEAEMVDWREQWEAAVTPIGLGVNAHPDEASAFLEELERLFDKLREADTLRKRIDGIDRDAAQHAGRVEALAAVVAADLSERPPEEAALELHQRLKRARDASARKETLEKQLLDAEERLRKAEAAIAHAEAALKGLCVEAGCSSVEELARTEQRSGLRRRLESDLAGVDEQLRRLSAGATVPDFIAEAAAVDPDGVSGEVGRLAEAIDGLERDRSDLDQAIGRERAELRRMDGADRAAALAEEFQGMLGRLETDLERYARLKIAARVLAMAIERYREKQQGPILTRASELFRRITCGSFEGVRAEFDETGNPVIVGIRSGGPPLGVEAMSDGTADQLYLALRLAGLEMYLEKNEALPFVVDDILILFDDERSLATLEVLAELSRRTQVIFFTHHRHLVELAKRHLSPSLLFDHVLAG